MLALYAVRVFATDLKHTVGGVRRRRRCRTPDATSLQPVPICWAL